MPRLRKEQRIRAIRMFNDERFKNELFGYDAFAAALYLIDY